MIGSLLLVGDTVDLDLAVHHHGRLHAGAGGWMGAEVVLVDLVETPEIPGVVEPDADANHMLQAVSSFLENGDEIADRLVRLGDDAAVDDFTILHGDLP